MIRRLVAQGVLERLSSGRYDCDRCRLAYIHWLRDRPSADKARLADEARLRAIKIGTAETKLGTYRDQVFKDVLMYMNERMGKFFAEFDGIPPRITR